MLSIISYPFHRTIYYKLYIKFLSLKVEFSFYFRMYFTRTISYLKYVFFSDVFYVIYHILSISSYHLL